MMSFKKVKIEINITSFSLIAYKQVSKKIKKQGSHSLKTGRHNSNLINFENKHPPHLAFPPQREKIKQCK